MSYARQSKQVADCFNGYYFIKEIILPSLPENVYRRYITGIYYVYNMMYI